MDTYSNAQPLPAPRRRSTRCRTLLAGLALTTSLTAVLARAPTTPPATAQRASLYLPVALQAYDADSGQELSPVGRGTERARTATANQPDAVRVRRDLQYRDDLPGVDPALVSLDLYNIRGAVEGRPLMVYVHGGGWQSGDKRAVGRKAEAFVAAGWVFASVNYRLSPDADFPAHAEDVAAAIAWLREQAGRSGVDGSRIALMGHSAGAHLVALVATDPRYLGAYGMAPSDLSAVVPVDTQAYDIPALAERLGGTLSGVYVQVFGSDPDGWLLASPSHYVEPERGIPPMAVAYSGGAGAPERPSAHRRVLSTAFAALLADAGIQSELIAAPEKTHGQINQDIGALRDDVTEAIFAFLARVGAGPAPRPAAGPTATTAPTLAVPPGARATPTPGPTPIPGGRATRPPRSTATPGTRPPRATSTPPGGAIVQRDLVYDTVAGRELRLDLYRPPGTEGVALPLVIWVHGGGWYAGSKDKTRAAGLVPEGFAVASVEYRLSREALWPAQIEDVRAAVRWLRANAGDLGVDPERFAAWGSSAGGHLVAMLGTAGDQPSLDGTGRGEPGVSSAVQAVVDWFGPSDLLRIAEHALPCTTIDHNAPTSPESVILGCTIPECPDRAAHASPITYVSANDPPMLIMHGTQDCSVPPLQSQVLHDAMRDAGAASTLIFHEGAGHGGATFTTDATWSTVVTFLRTELGVR